MSRLEGELAASQAENAQIAAEERLAAAEAWWAHDNLGEDEPPIPRPDLAGPFCGCNTCVVREVLSAAWDLLKADSR